MRRYSSDENSFTLLSVCEERGPILERDIAECQMQMAALSAGSEDLLRLQQRLDGLQSDLADERLRLQKQKEENVRRRHNFCPMIVSLLKALAAKGNTLQGLVDSARKRRGAV